MEPQGTAAERDAGAVGRAAEVAGHVLEDRLEAVLIEAGFDAFAEALYQPYYAAVLEVASLPPGR